MSRKYLNDRWCVRCGRKSPCPYLVRNIGILNREAVKDKLVLDCGCGNGRNSIYLQSLGFKDVRSLDMAGDFGVKCVLGKDKLPARSRSSGLILCDYVFMFLDEKERGFLCGEIDRVASDGCFLVVELYPAKDSYFKDEKNILDFQEKLYNKLNKTHWFKVKYSKQKFILEKKI